MVTQAATLLTVQQGWPQIFFLLLFKKLMLFERQICRERGDREKRQSLCWFTPQIAAITGVGPFESQKLPLGLPHGPSTRPSFTVFPSTLLGSSTGSGAARLEQALIWDAGPASRGSTYYSAALAPCFYRFFPPHQGQRFRSVS